MRTIGPTGLSGRWCKGMHMHKLTIYLVELCYMIAELSSQHHLVIEFVPSCQCSEFRTWELCDWREVQTIDGHADEVHHEHHENGRGDDPPGRTCEILVHIHG